MRFPWVVIGLLTLVACEEFAPVNPKDYPLGLVAFKTSCNPAANVTFQNALALMHHHAYEKAEAEFEEVTELDPECAMARWGIAMTQFDPLSPEGPRERRLSKGAAAIEKARNLGAGTDRESAYIEAAGAYYRNWKQLDHVARIAAWEKAQDALHRDHPGDIDAAALYALAHLATAPTGDRTYEHNERSGELLERIHAEAPIHPGAIHYITHAYDTATLATRGEAITRAYDTIVPGVPHPLHMPARIFVRTGSWNDAVSWSLRSAAAAKLQPVGNLTSSDYPRAMSYLVYAYLQGAWDSRAAVALQRLGDSGDYEDSFVTAYALAAAPARYALERGEWAEAAALEPRTPGTIPWEKYPAAEAITYFARALGAARSGNLRNARNTLGGLERFHDRLAESDETHWATRVAAQRKVVAAWIALKENEETALQLMREAADLEEAHDKLPVSPGSILPAREQLGDMLIGLNRKEEALAAFEACLAVAPGRFNSLYGAALASELTGDSEKAAEYYGKILDVAGKSRSKRPGLIAAKLYMGRM